jgi:hypothetical protein
MRCSKEKRACNRYNRFISYFWNNLMSVKPKLHILSRSWHSLRVSNIWSYVVLGNIFILSFFHFLYPFVIILIGSTPDCPWLLRFAVPVFVWFHCKNTLWAWFPKSLIMKALTLLLDIGFLAKLHLHPSHRNTKIWVWGLVFILNIFNFQIPNTLLFLQSFY